VTTLIDQYIIEVGQHLPKKMSADIKEEIRSFLEDTLEDRSQAPGQPPDEELVVEVLKEFGPPEKVAASYLPEKYLIGPQLYPVFIPTLRIVLTIIAVLSLVGLGISLTQAGPAANSIIEVFIKGLVGFGSSALQALGNIVLIFAILQWTLPEVKSKVKEWDPRTLKARMTPERVQTIPLLWDIAFTIGAFLLFNFYPQYVGIGNYNGEWVFTSILTPVFFSYLPWLDLAWVLTIILDIILIRQGRWQAATHWFSIGNSVLAIVILLVMLTGAPIVNLNPADMASLGWPQVLRQLMSHVNSFARLILAFIIFLESAELAKKLYQFLWEKHR
jgi:hypothetical protein